ncbi:hypothetical protein [Bradyrhizobium erythrophlei]|uniref:Uncharacterized protein n=1 Tax=Bradyrhizobium erythrophlei TaxID=1437360 RepID=A0A1M7TRW9_9BRAD|nr:hypothetical protein [Bradyrhizobium erythrophlei]SHN73477.1 hypothetical protein SAMN05444170_2487 [Bradyrhizobium erythrophlei]
MKVIYAGGFVILFVVQTVPARSGELAGYLQSYCSRSDLDPSDQAICRNISKRPARAKAIANKVVKPDTTPVPPPKAMTASTNPLTQPGCWDYSKRIFVRADPLDNFYYDLDPQASSSSTDAKGATASYTNDQLAKTQNATVNGRVSYLAFGAHCQDNPREPFVLGYAVAPFVSANGSWADPAKKGTNSALRAGTDIGIAVSTTEWFIKDHFWYLSPFYQTDFSGFARVQGATLAYEPVAPLLALGATGAGSPYYSFFWQFRAETDWLNVNEVGLTNLTKGDTAHYGAIVRTHLGLFPIRDENHLWPDWLVGRFSIIGTAQYFRDSRTNADLPYYSIALQYKLGSCKSTDSSAPKTGDVAQCVIPGTSSVSLEYDNGTDKDTLVKVNQVLLKFGFAL